MKKQCNCKSYNKPEWGGEKPEVCLPKPEWSPRQNTTICIDACIADAIQMLWDNGIHTANSCCGHNKWNPTIILENSSSQEECDKAKRLLSQNDGRDWKILQWRLVSIDKKPFYKK